MNDFCSTLRERRKRVGLSQERLAEKAGVYPETIRNIENGRTKNPFKYTRDVINAAIEEERQNKLRILTRSES